MKLPWCRITVLLADPRDRSFYKDWVPEDDDMLKNLMTEIRAIEGITVEIYDNHRKLLQDWIFNPPQYVLNQCDNGYLNMEAYEGHLCSVMDILGVPYSGSNAETFIITKDKSIARGIAQSIGIPTPYEIYLSDRTDLIENIIPKDFPYPALIKPANSSGSNGILFDSLVLDHTQIIDAIKKVRQDQPNRPLLIQEFLSGTEFSVGLIGNPDDNNLEILPPLEVDYSSLDSKYPKIQLGQYKCDSNSEFWQQTKEIRASLSEEQLNTICNYARKLYIRCNCRDYARMDFRMDRHGVIKIMDINPNCWLGGKFKMMGEFAGYSWNQLLYKLLCISQQRCLREK